MLLFVCIPAFAKDRQWQEGKLLDSEEKQESAGMSVEFYQYYVIEGPELTYVCCQHLIWRWSKPADLIVNTPVKFAISKNDLFILDQQGKEYKTKIVKKTAR
jgi:hypothetical protein